jgi:membrane protein DedA with SNARE-associated domain
MVEAFLARYGYLAVFALLVGAGTGVPIPEEPTQLAAGVLAQRGTLALGVAMATCWLGIIAGDALWFGIARKLGPRVLERRPVCKVLTPERRARIESHLGRHGFLTVMVSRHLSGLRLPAFALAATHGVRWRTFLLADGASALISVPLVVSAGYLGARQLARVQGDLRRVELGILIAFALAISLVILIRRSRRARGVALPGPQRAGD